MSGTSLDGIDAAIIRSDGETVDDTGMAITVPYDPDFRKELREGVKSKRRIPIIENELTRRHADVIHKLLKKHSLTNKDIDVIGFYGQTITHRPDEGVTWQIANGSLLAELTRINVVTDFRRRDIAAGGQGAPLAPMFHKAVTLHIPKPIAIVNIGGVANATYLSNDGSVLAFDTGPGIGLIDDWVFKHTKKTYDEDGNASMKGKINERVLKEYLMDEYFDRPLPKSLDRKYFTLFEVEGIPFEDGAATLSAFTAHAIAKSMDHFPEEPKSWYITGGGRKNRRIMEELKGLLDAPVEPIEVIGLNGDMFEAQAFAYFAVRSILGLPISIPSVTGASYSATGGAFYRA